MNKICGIVEIGEGNVLTEDAKNNLIGQTISFVDDVSHPTEKRVRLYEVVDIYEKDGYNWYKAVEKLK